MVNLAASYSPKHFLLKAQSNCLCFADSRILYFSYVLESIHKCIIELLVLQFLFVRGSNKNKGGGGLFQILQKERLFHLFWQPSCSQCGIQDKGLPLPLRLANKRIYLDIQLKAELTNLFWKLPGYSLFLHRRSRQWMCRMWELW